MMLPPSSTPSIKCSIGAGVAAADIGVGAAAAGTGVGVASADTGAGAAAAGTGVGAAAADIGAGAAVGKATVPTCFSTDRARPRKTAGPYLRHCSAILLWRFRSPHHSCRLVRDADF